MPGTKAKEPGPPSHPLPNYTQPFFRAGDTLLVLFQRDVQAQLLHQAAGKGAASSPGFVPRNFSLAEKRIQVPHVFPQLLFSRMWMLLT